MKWISIKDRVPDDGVLVLILADSLDEDIPYRDVGIYENNKWNVKLKPFAKSVTHWMPFPPINNESERKKLIIEETVSDNTKVDIIVGDYLLKECFVSYDISISITGNGSRGNIEFRTDKPAVLIDVDKEK